MTKLPVEWCFRAALCDLSREDAAKQRARLFAERVREGLTPEDAAALASMLELIATGTAPAVALGFSAPGGRPRQFELHLAIYNFVEDLHGRQQSSLAHCYERAGVKFRKSPDSIERIHRKMAKAHHVDGD